MDKKIIYDIGLHKGEDTLYYLARGYKVIAIEADPDLVLYCQKKFKTQIDSGDLVIIQGAIIENDDQTYTKFFKNNEKTDWGTVEKKWADRNAKLGFTSIEMEVPVVNFKNLFSTYGCPYYLKIDIEGMDIVCLKKLLKTDYRPKFVSIESEKVNFNNLIEEFNVFQALGYKKFYIKQQEKINLDSVPLNSKEGKYINYKLLNGSTGLFGTDLGVNWVNRDEAIRMYSKIFKMYKYFGDTSIFRRTAIGRYFLYILSRLTGKSLPGWYDTHASID